jgi:hypothetical protein
MDQTEPATATLRLRGRRGPVPGTVFWPGTGGPARRPVVALEPVQPETLALCRRTGRVVLALASGEHDAWDLVCWVAAHAAELGARPDALLLAGDTATIQPLLTRALAEGWPSLTVYWRPEQGEC